MTVVGPSRSENAEKAALILFNACTKAGHAFDHETRRDALDRIVKATDVCNLLPLDAAFAVAEFYMLKPQRNGGLEITIEP